MSDHEINPVDIQEKLGMIGEVVEYLLEEMYGERMGFCLLSVQFGEPTFLSKIDYVGNILKSDIIKMLRDAADNLENNKGTEGSNKCQKLH